MGQVDSSLGGLAKRNAVWLILAAVVIAGYFAGIWIYALRTPFGDDFGMIAGADAFAAATTPGEAWAALAGQHNEHRPVLVRLVFWLVGLMPGPLNTQLIVLLGNLSLVLMFALLMREGRRVAAPGAFIVVAAAMMFNFGTSEAAIWAITAVQNFGALSIVLTMLVLLSKGGAWSWAALACAVLAVGVQGNNLLAPFIGAAFLLIDKRWAPAALWAVIGALLAVWYLSDFTRSSGVSDPMALISRAPEIVAYALAFCGAVAGFGGESIPPAVNLLFVSTAMLTGATMIALSVYAGIRGGFGKGRIALWVNVFIVISAFAAAASRIDYGIQQALVPRYHINSCLMVVTTLIALLDLPENDPVRAFIRKAMSVFGVLAFFYVIAVTPILLLMHQMYQSPASIEAAASIPLASLDDACAYSGSGNGTMSGQPCISP